MHYSSFPELVLFQPPCKPQLCLWKGWRWRSTLSVSSFLTASPAQRHDGQSYLLQKRDRALHPPLALWLPTLFISKSKRESGICGERTLAAVSQTELMVGRRSQSPSVDYSTLIIKDEIDGNTDFICLS